MKTFCDQDIERASQLLKSGKLVAIPTETVYGLAANGLDDNAVRQIFEVKKRPFYDPLILHTDRMEKVKSWVLEFPEPLEKLAAEFWPGPLTLLLSKSNQIPDLISAGLPRVAIRIPNHKLTLDLLSELDFPLAAPSANPFGYVSPTKAQHVLNHFDGIIEMVLDGGPATVGIESTIVGMEENQAVIYRLGGLSKERIESAIGPVEVKDSSSKPSAPGMLEKHYSPRKKIQVVDSKEGLESTQSLGAAYILFSIDPPKDATHVIQLSQTDNHNEAAQRFYDALQHWDNNPEIDTLVIERLPDFDLGRAINDRLKRAAV